jgi:hypothetical protein
MKNKLAAFVYIFLLLVAFSAFIAWIGGYNFDTRGPFIAYMTFASIFASAAIAKSITEFV